MAKRAGKLMKFNHEGMKRMPVGEVQSYAILGRSVRRERQIVDGVTLYRFTLDPGYSTEYSTFWSTDAQKLFNGVLNRINRKKLT